MGGPETTKQSYDKSASLWADNHWTHNQEKDLGLIPILKKFVEIIGNRGSVLDAGCGPGRDTKFLLECGIKTIGIDFSDGMLEEAKKRVPNGDFRKMDMRVLDFEDNAFEGVWACASLLHFPKNEISKSLKEFGRVLKPNGILCALVKEGTGEGIETEKYGPRFFAYYQKEEFENKVKESGFEVVDSGINKGEKWNWIWVFAKPDK
ncbi:MAG: class I SAM-dependent methyltransferase [Candidatus Aenigmatarchaeota archaeon]